MDLNEVRKQTRAHVGDVLGTLAFACGYIIAGASGVFGAYWLLRLNGAVAVGGLGAAGVFAPVSRAVQKHIRQRKSDRMTNWSSQTPPLAPGDMQREIHSLLGDWLRSNAILLSVITSFAGTAFGLFYLARLNGPVGGASLVGAGMMLKLTWWLHKQLTKRRAAREARLYGQHPH
ncbi:MULTISPECIES: hypothetical protein [unclassified Streptomyces]|uniref:hypothetical protein n=1 Tax=unclassified Streptomyces TaxID=2593676 RepID=UPI002DDB83D1|nr:hypothetical protein [Streptomyces sp. NBC_01750]WSA97897.1 hypothetical protein OIE54_00575 [Streptomyces sp. NBC_01794]WSD30583.1 hypothetical protein OG966_00445 [Streptomyces sp. NBC_01750]